MNEELTKFETDREEQLRVMRERHAREMSSFDNSPSSSSIGSSNVIANNCKSGSQFTGSPSGSHSSSQFKSTGTPI